MACRSNMGEEELTCFRTKQCNKDNCSFGVQRCQYSHNFSWPRRCPVMLNQRDRLRYRPELCPVIGAHMDHSVCQNGRECSYAHTTEEVDFHPSIYKTRPCDAKGKCHQFFCTRYHNKYEQKSPKPRELYVHAKTRQRLVKDSATISTRPTTETSTTSPTVAESSPADILTNITLPEDLSLPLPPPIYGSILSSPESFNMLSPTFGSTPMNLPYMQYPLPPVMGLNALSPSAVSPLLISPHNFNAHLTSPSPSSDGLRTTLIRQIEALRYMTTILDSRPDDVKDLASLVETSSALHSVILSKIANK